jgi:hypothetical protein
MKHSLAKLLETVYQHYPRGLAQDDPGYAKTEAYCRLSAARRRAGIGSEAWNALLERADARFPGHGPLNRSLHLPMGTMDAAYSGYIFMDITPRLASPPMPTLLPRDMPMGGPHAIGFMISFICPYYVVYSSRYVDDLEATEAALRAPPRTTVLIISDDVARLLPLSVVTPEIRAEAEREDQKRRERLRREPIKQRVIAFDPLPDEKPYTDWLTRDIEATFGCECMPPEIGSVIVPDVATNNCGLGETRIYDCLLSDDW